MGAELGRISGPLLSANLLRNGVDLAFENDLLYLKVSPSVSNTNPDDGDLNPQSGGNAIGINTDAPWHPLTVNGTFKSLNLIATSQADIANTTFVTNKIQNAINSIYLQPDQSSDPIITSTKFATANLEISNQLIKNIVTDSDIDLSPTGKTIFNTYKVNVNGNLHATGDITWDGNITFGTDDLDSVAFKAEVKSNIIPDTNDQYDLGSLSKNWNTLYVQDVNAGVSTNNSVTVNNINLISTVGKTIFVSTNGSDTAAGLHEHNPVRTVKKALQLASSGDEVVIYPGTYEEQFPLTVPQGVAVRGSNIRAVTVVPTVATNNKDAFLLNGETTVSNLTVKDYFYDSVNNTGYAFRLANNFNCTTRSPYIQNVTVITTENIDSAGSVTVGPATTLFSFTSDSVNLSKDFYSQALVDSLVGQIAVIDRYPSPPLYYTVVSIVTDSSNSNEWRMTVDAPFNTAGQLRPISFYPDVGLTQIVTNDIWDTTGNSIGEKWVAWYKYNLPGSFATTVQPGWTINVAGQIYVVDYIIEDPVNTNMWRIYVTTSLVAGVGIPIFSSPIISLAGYGALVDGGVANSSSREATILFFSATMIIPGADGITVTNGGRCEWLNSFTYYANRGIHLTQGTLGFASLGVRYGAEMRSINSANVYGTYGAVADGADTLGYLIGHNFGYIGSGTDSTNDRSLVIQANEIVELNNGHLYYDSMDHKGDYRVGNIFYVNQEAGTVTFDAQSIDFGSAGNITLESPTSTTIIDKTQVATGNIRIYDNNIDSTIGPVNLLAFSGNTYLNTDVDVTGSVYITGDNVVHGTVYLGNQPFDLITITPDLTQNILPKTTNTFNLGQSGVTPKVWDTAFISQLVVDGTISINSNTITALTTDTDLVIDAIGSGKVKVQSTDVEITNDLTVDTTSTLNAVNVGLLGDPYTLTHYGNVNQTGNVDRVGNTNITGYLKLNGAYIDQFQDIQISGNTVTTTLTNSNLELDANGTGIIDLNDNVTIENNLDVLGTSYLTSVVGIDVLTANKFDTSDISIEDNIITTKTTDTDLVLSADGIGIISIPNKNVDVTYNLSTDGIFTVNGDSSVKYVDLTGNITQTGNIDQTGNTYIIGTFANNNISITGSSYFEVDAINIFNNSISATATNNDLVFSASGTGGVIVDNLLKFDLSTISNVNASPTTDLEKGIIFTPNGTGNVSIDTVRSLKIPVGNPSTRTLSIGEIRYNNLTNLYEGGGTAGLISFVGLYDTARQTTITPELTPGNNDNTFRFITANTVDATLDSVKFKDNTIVGGNISFSSNNISNTISTNDIDITVSGTGIVDINNIDISNGQIVNNENLALTFQTTGNGYVKFSGTGALYIPYGSTLDRPLTPETGTVRNNSDTGVMEVYSGVPALGDNGWVAAVGPSGAATLAEINSIIEIYTLILG